MIKPHVGESSEIALGCRSCMQDEQVSISFAGGDRRTAGTAKSTSCLLSLNEFEWDVAMCYTALRMS